MLFEVISGMDFAHKDTISIWKARNEDGTAAGIYGDHTVAIGLFHSEGPLKVGFLTELLSAQEICEAEELLNKN